MLVSHSSWVRLRPAIRQAASTQWSGSRSQICTPSGLAIASRAPVVERAMTFYALSAMPSGVPRRTPVATS